MVVKVVIPKKRKTSQAKATVPPAEVVEDSLEASEGMLKAVPAAPDAYHDTIQQQVDIVVDASQFEVTSIEKVNHGVIVLQEIKEMKAKVEEWLGPQKDAAYNAWQVTLKVYKKAMEPLKDAELILKDKISDFELAEEKRIEKEKAKAVKPKMTKNGFRPAPVVVKAKKASGLVSQDDWKITVDDPVKLLKAVVSGKTNINLDKLVTIKTGVIKSYIRATGQTKIPGCTVQKGKIQQVR